jgi:hypothetical protein
MIAITVGAFMFYIKKIMQKYKGAIFNNDSRSTTEKKQTNSG